jgi:hypothetical protein
MLLPTKVEPVALYAPAHWPKTLSDTSFVGYSERKKSFEYAGGECEAET